uniref:CCHC-type domain-containing protein n=1 Tax=Populus alba TaxID=43335 RepID=A0A4U5PYK8_POPAL|nr:hypothetical protein D5086_0000166380 [Populus alba]
MKFLVGLHDSYSSVRSQLLLQTPLPSMGRVFSLLLQEESQRSLTNAAGIPIDWQAMIAEHYHNQNSKSGSNYTTRFAKHKGKIEATCTHCGYPGHTADKCFQLIGYPPGWKGPRGKRLATMPHTSKNFQRLPTAHHTTALQPHLDTPNIVFSQEQMQNLLTLANSISSSKLNNTATEVNTPLVFPDYPQHFDPFPCRPSNTTLHDSVVPATLPIQPSVPHISTLPPPLTQLRKSERTKHPPTYLTQYYCGHMAQIASATPDSSPCFLPEQATPAADSPTPEDSRRLAMIS